MINASYDNIGDVLYVQSRAPHNTKNTEAVSGLILRYDRQTRAPVAATILDFHEYWDTKREELVDRLSTFFGIPKAEARRLIERDALSDEAVERRATDALRRALTTPYKPQSKLVGTTKRAKARKRRAKGPPKSR